MAGSEYDFLYDLERVDFCARGLHYLSRIQYGREHPRQYMECIYKEGEAQYPVLIWIHGGAWQDENLTSSYRPEPVLAELAEMGWFIACIEYRLAQHGSFPVSLHDCQEAVKFLRRNETRFRLDSNHIVVWGESAGAHLACMVGANCNEEPGSQVQGVVAWYCPSDLLAQSEHQRKQGEDNFVEKLVGVSGDEAGERIREASPIAYSDRKMAPVLLMHGDIDDLVDYSQSVHYAQKLKEAGNDVTFITVPNQGHGFFRGQQYYDEVIRFLQEKIRR